LSFVVEFVAHFGIDDRYGQRLIFEIHSTGKWYCFGTGYGGDAYVAFKSVILVCPKILMFLNLLTKYGAMSIFGKISGIKNGSKLERWYCSMGLSSWVMAFLMASDKQSSKSIFLLSHFVNVDAETTTKNK
jgi:hypothetical protein